MNVESAIKAIDLFESVQAGHFALLKEGVTILGADGNESPDFTHMTDEREQAMLALKSVMDAVLSQAEVGDLKSIEPLVSRMEGLINKEDELKFLVHKARQELKKKLSHMQNGKKALGGYHKTLQG